MNIKVCDALSVGNVLHRIFRAKVALCYPRVVKLQNKTFRHNAIHTEIVDVENDTLIAAVAKEQSGKIEDNSSTSNVSKPGEKEALKSSVNTMLAEKTESDLREDPSQSDADSFQKGGPRPLNEARLPTSKLGRIFQYTSLATSLGVGTATEALKRAVGLSESKVGESSLWNEANVQLIVKRLSRMRGAAQKLGQILSIQDANVLPPQIERILFDIQHAGTHMPRKQLLQVLVGELGENWRDFLVEFDEQPIAAASIGQVHWARDNEGMQLAFKVQYPGVADAIDSDLDSLKLLLLASRILPRGLYLEKTIEVARRELRWETDYLREANFAQRFRDALRSSPAFRVPEIKTSLSTARVLAMERLPGFPLSQILDSPQETRNWIATQLMHLSLREVFEFKFMQTDPNWSNFLYDSRRHQLGLLDFGATREFSDDFLTDYLGVLKAGVAADKESCTNYSLRLGYLTGDEHQAMIDAHVESILTLAEPFRAPNVYDFSDQTITTRVRDLIPKMLNLRLTPPPEPTYSLHRKLSGAFLLCARLRAQVDCKAIFQDVASKYKPSP